MLKNKIALPVIGLMMLATALVFALSAHANPLSFFATSQTATATTSPSFMTAGKATTTLVFDSYAAGQPKATDFANLFISFSGSSTSSVLNTDVEYSQDGIDWYQDGGTYENGYATTTKPADISQVNEYKWTFSSSTAGLPTPGANNATSTRALLLKTPTRYIRAVFSMPAGSTAGAVWAQFVPARQQSN